MNELKLKPGQIIKIGNAHYGRCAVCGRTIRVDRLVTGSLHFCR